MKKSRFGYSLIELLIFMGMLSIMLVVLTQIFSLIVNARLESESTSTVAQDGNYLLNRFIYDISRANSINLPATVGATDVSLDITIDGINYVYALNNGILQITTNGNIYRLNNIDSTISNLTFKRIGNGDGKDTIQIGFTVTSTIQQAKGAESQNYQITAGLC